MSDKHKNGDVTECEHVRSESPKIPPQLANFVTTKRTRTFSL